MKNGQRGHDTHQWKFFSSGGVHQVILSDAEDLRNLDKLDLKLWMALSVPDKGIEFDPATAAFLDSDGDGFIRPGEILASVRWICSILKDPGKILTSAECVRLEDILDAALRGSAKRLLEDIGKTGSAEILLDDVIAHRKTLGDLPYNGDGILTVAVAETEALKTALEDIIATQGPVTDKSGKPGVDARTLENFEREAISVLAWRNRLADDRSLLPLGREGTPAAVDAMEAVETKVDDFFARCGLIAFDPRSAIPLNREEADYRAVAAGSLKRNSPSIGDFPLALAAAGKALPLDGRVNPAWAEAVAALAAMTLTPLTGKESSELKETDWVAVKAALAPYRDWLSARPDVAAASVPPGRLEAFVSEGMSRAIMSMIEKDLAAGPAYALVADLEKLLRYQRDLGSLLRNSVNFADFYSRVPALFQMGTLYLDARSCRLCLDARDDAKHAALAGLSGAFLVYCDITRPGGTRRKIVALVTDGDSDSVIAGRNGIFVDRSGLDWNATVTKVLLNPVSVRQAFWLPYRKFFRMIEEQVGKRAKTAEDSSNAKLSEAAGTVVMADKSTPGTAAPVIPKKLDLGTIALIGTAIGGMSALVAGILQTVFGLGIWLPVGILGVILLISGPSMVLASLKLRKRNLGPILDANGWAINTKALVNIPFGATMTSLASLPPGTMPFMADPFAQKRSHWKRNMLFMLLAVLAVVGVAWGFGSFDAFLDETWRTGSVFNWFAGTFKAPGLPR